MLLIFCELENLQQSMIAVCSSVVSEVGVAKRRKPTLKYSELKHQLNSDTTWSSRHIGMKQSSENYTPKLLDHYLHLDQDML